MTTTTITPRILRGTIQACSVCGEAPARRFKGVQMCDECIALVTE